MHYFNDTITPGITGDWNDLDNWFSQLNDIDGGTSNVPAVALPSSGDDVKLYKNVTGNNGSPAACNNLSVMDNVMLDIEVTCTLAQFVSFLSRLGAAGEIVGNAEFIGDSFNDYNQRCSNYGTITGNATFGAVYACNESSGVITGDAIFSATQCNNEGHVLGNAYFTGSSCYNTMTGIVDGNAEFTNEYGANDGAIIGDAYFDESIGHANNGTIGGVATFDGPSNNYNTNYGLGTAISVIFGYTGTIAAHISDPLTVQGPVTIENELVIDFEAGDFFDGDTTDYIVNGSLTFQFADGSFNNGIIVSNVLADFYGYQSYNIGVIYGNPVFSGEQSSNTTPTLGVVGIATFSGLNSYNGGSVNGTTILSGSGSYTKDDGDTGLVDNLNVILRHPTSFVSNVIINGELVFEKREAIAATLNYSDAINLPVLKSTPSAIKLPFADILGTGLL